MPDTSDLLQQGIALAKAGSREEARNILMQVVELDEQNESAWLWLSGVVDSDDDKAVALENVLALNPDNDWAKRGLKLLGRPVPGE
jgi:Flp pilus assembly protein TadD